MERIVFRHLLRCLSCFCCCSSPFCFWFCAGTGDGFQASPDQNPRGTANMEPFAPSSSLESRKVEDDPLIIAAKREGIITEGKTREQIASELAWKLNKK